MRMEQQARLFLPCLLGDPSMQPITHRTRLPLPLMLRLPSQ